MPSATASGLKTDFQAIDHCQQFSRQSLYPVLVGSFQFPVRALASVIQLGPCPEILLTKLVCLGPGSGQFSLDISAIIPVPDLLLHGLTGGVLGGIVRILLLRTHYSGLH
jgi:hypothetical protein